MAMYNKNIQKSKKTTLRYFTIMVLILFLIATIIAIKIGKKSNNQMSVLKENNYLNRVENELINQNDENLISSKYLITDNTIEKIEEQTKVEDFLKEFDNQLKLFSNEKNQEEVTSGIVLGTMYAEDTEGNIYDLIVDGDVNNDGFVNEIDISKIIRGEISDNVSEKASEFGIEKISNKVVYGEYDLGDVKEVASPEIEIVSGEKGENDYFISDVEVKINIKSGATKNVYKIKGTEEKDITEIEENETINFKNDGIYKLIAYSYGEEGNKSKTAQKIIKINKTELEASLTYTPETATIEPVIAKVTFNKEGVTITNNEGKDTFEFTTNGSFVFEFKDEAGRIGNIVATVDWIKKEEIIGQDGIWKYFLNDDGTIQITQYLGDNTEIVIPANYDGYEVYAVGNQYAERTKENRLNIFGDIINTTATKLVIENGIKEIKLAAFSGCTGFTGNLVLPESIEKIEGLAFESCSGFTGDLIIPDSIKELGTSVFQRCSGFDGKLIISNQLTEIPDYTFNYCSNLVGPLQFPENITRIGRTSFQNCNKLEGTLNIPETVISIGDYAFNKCSSLTGDLILPKNLKTLGRTVFQQCKGFNGKLVLPDGLETIEPYTFTQCTNLTGTLNIPSTVNKIDTCAFYNCSKLTGDLIIPEGVTKVGEAAFENCSGFNGTLQLPNTLTEVDDFAFDRCSNLTGSLIIPDSVTSIGNVAFQCLYKMTGELKISKNIKTIGRFAFYDDKFTGELIIPEGLEELGHAAFGKNTGFSNKTIVIPSTLKKIGIDAEFDGKNIGFSTHDFYNFGANNKNFEEFVVAEGNEYFKAVDGVLYTIDGKRMISYPRNKKDEIFELPESVITLDELSISSNCTLDTLIIPDNFVLDPIPYSIRMEGSHILTAALYNYNEINNIVAKETNPNYTSVDGVLYNKDITELVYISSGRTSEVIIPEGVTSIRDRAIYWNQVYYIKASKIYIPASLENITDSQISSLNSVSKKIEVSPDNTKFTVDANNKLIRK